MKDRKQSREEVWGAVMSLIQETGDREAASVWAVTASVYSMLHLSNLFSGDEAVDIVEEVRALLESKIRDRVARMSRKVAQA